MSLLAAIFVSLQWWEMHTGGKDTHDLASAAANQAIWTQRLANDTDTESSYMKELANRMKDQADRTREEAEETKVLADQARVQALAAKSAAETANFALHVSERAYLAAGYPTMNADAGNVAIPILNSGHIPSGKVTVIAHEATINIANLDQPAIKIIPVETHWKQYEMESIPTIGVGSVTINIPTPGAAPAKVKTGYQQIVVVGTITYGDGFKDDTDVTRPFCYGNLLYTVTKELQWSACDSSLYLPELIEADHYPSGEYK